MSSTNALGSPAETPCSSARWMGTFGGRRLSSHRYVAVVGLRPSCSLLQTLRAAADPGLPGQGSRSPLGIRTVYLAQFEHQRTPRCQRRRCVGWHWLVTTPRHGVERSVLRLSSVLVNNLQYIHSLPPPARGASVCGPASEVVFFLRGFRAALGPTSGQCLLDHAIATAIYLSAANSAALSSTVLCPVVSVPALLRTWRASWRASASARALPVQFWSSV